MRVGDKCVTFGYVWEMYRRKYFMTYSLCRRFKNEINKAASNRCKYSEWNSETKCRTLVFKLAGLAMHQMASNGCGSHEDYIYCTFLVMHVAQLLMDRSRRWPNVITTSICVIKV